MSCVLCLVSYVFLSCALCLLVLYSHSTAKQTMSSSNVAINIEGIDALSYERVKTFVRIHNVMHPDDKLDCRTSKVNLIIELKKRCVR